jgi:hypothetical protein
MCQFCLPPGADTLLGPEMRSTGEVMGIDKTFGKAYAKAAIAAGQTLPESGNVFITMVDKYKDAVVPVAKELVVSPCGSIDLPSLMLRLWCTFALPLAAQRALCWKGSSGLFKCVMGVVSKSPWPFVSR